MLGSVSASSSTAGCSQIISSVPPLRQYSVKFIDHKEKGATYQDAVGGQGKEIGAGRSDGAGDAWDGTAGELRGRAKSVKARQYGSGLLGDPMHRAGAQSGGQSGSIRAPNKSSV